MAQMLLSRLPVLTHSHVGLIRCQHALYPPVCRDAGAHGTAKSPEEKKGNAMMVEEIYTKVTSIFRELFDIPDLVVTPELTADDISEWDSISHLRLMLTIEKTFAVKFSALQIGKLKNVGDLVALIQSKQPA